MSRLEKLRLRALLLALVVGIWACGDDEGAPGEGVAAPALPVPEAAGRRPSAEVVVAGHGSFRIELLPDVAPLNVAKWLEHADAGGYDGTTFHRVVPGFVIQGGDPNSRNRDPRDDGYGCQYWLRTDEYSELGHFRGIVGVANFGADHTGACQWFVVTAEHASELDGYHTIIGHVTEGMEVVLSVEAVEVDTYGRHGPTARPVENVRIESVQIDFASAAPPEPSAEADADAKEATAGTADEASGMDGG